MTIKEMHTAFLVLGQQMGMQNMRNILPNEIDVFLNAAIIDEVRKVILSNTTQTFPDKVSAQKNAISPINFIRTLYKSGTPTIDNNVLTDNFDVMLYLSVSVKYEHDGKVYGCRIIEEDELANTLNDYCNGASFDYPIASFSNDSWKIYSGNRNVIDATINYIANPTKVSYKSNINCDLPEYTHNQIIEAAITKYFASVGQTSQNVN